MARARKAREIRNTEPAGIKAGGLFASATFDQGWEDHEQRDKDRF